MKQNYAFISYSSKSQQSADAVRMLLADENIHSWMAPYDIPAGYKYAHVINDAIERCKCFILLLTEESQKSEHVEKEVDRAVTYKKPIVPIQLGNIVLNSGFKYYLGNSQIVAMSAVNADSEEWLKAISAVKSFIYLSETQERDNIEKSSCTEILPETGGIGKNINWKLEANGDLYIYGTGEMNCSILYGQTLDALVADSLLKNVKERVKRLFIMNGIETIGEYSFFQFSNLLEVYVPFTVKKIAAGAFKDCINLRHIELPWQFKEIGLYAFQNCHNLENFELPDDVFIGSEAFKDCWSLTMLEKCCNKSITIFQNSFENCTGLKKVVLENVNLVGMHAFKGCCALSFLNLSFRRDGLIKKGRTLQAKAFEFSGVKEIHLTFPSKTKMALSYSIDNKCFEGCDRLTDIFFEDAIPYIRDSAFPKNRNICIHVREKSHGLRMIYKAFGEDCKIVFSQED